MQSEIIEMFEEQIRGWALTIALAERNLGFQEDRLKRQVASSQLSPAVRREVQRIQDLIVANREKINESKAQISNARDRLDDLREIDLPEAWSEEDIAVCITYLKTGISL